ncbi:hypothetical protein MMC27_006388 [Xylographa pallens]|nr:hypothetical protein [Xylographa pallens]
METSSTLVSNAKSSDSSLRALLHPLVLLTISDYITRHTLRRQTQPIVGALLGQQNGREVSLEHAYEVKLIHGEKGDAGWKLSHDWFQERLQQYKDVHKDPALDLVGWWTTCPESGPGPEMLAMQHVIMERYNEAALLLAFHPASVLDGGNVGGKLPLTIYESAFESGSGEQGKDMQVDGDEGLELRFRELAYEVVTGEAEMISVDFVARGGGNATAVDGTVKKSGKAQASQTPLSEKSDVNGKGKGKAVEKETAPAEDASGLTPEDEERKLALCMHDIRCLSTTDTHLVIASLTTRANATRMLQSRISLLKSYLERLPPSYLTTASPQPPDPTTQTTPSEDQTEISHPILRSLLALTARLPLLTPADHASFVKESQAEKSDVSLVALLGSLGRSIQDAKGLGTKFSVVEGAKLGGRKGVFGSMGMGMGMGMGMSMGMGGAMGMGGIGEEGMGLDMQSFGEDDGNMAW